MSILYDMKHGTEYLNYGRHIISGYCKYCVAVKDHSPVKVLDLGAGSGTDLLNCKESIGESVALELYALEDYPPNVEMLRNKGIHVSFVNIENDMFPFEDGSMDIVIMNQVLEHTKEVFWIFGEISRILKKGGHCIVGVPNLASFHNRIALFFGMQPSSIRTMGPHIRGFTKKDFIKFIETDGYFKADYFAGSNFYPFPPMLSNVLCKALPTMSVSIFIGMERTEKDGNFVNVLENRFFETPFYKGKTTETN